jgi:trimethylamine--corrinoid protein Co-methyltransferase
VINSNSPRQLDIPMCMGLIDFAAAGQVAVVTPFTLAGAMAPVTLAGALTLQHAEAMAGIALTQAVRPGAPVVYGAFTSNVDMKSGAPAFGTPEYFKAALASGQLARHVGLPYRSSAPNASNAPDAQAMYETMISLFGAVWGGCNLLLHCAGWLEGGLTASKEKFILDIEVLQMLAESFQPIVVDADEIGLDAIAETSPGGHFFGGAHTLARYRTAFYEPLVSDWANFGQWTEEGSRDATQRANEIWKQILAEFEPPPIDDAIAAELDEFVARRTAEGGAPPES